MRLAAGPNPLGNNSAPPDLLAAKRGWKGQKRKEREGGGGGTEGKDVKGLVVS